MADMEFEPLHDGSDEEDQILQKKPKEREKRHSRSKSTPLFKKVVDKKDKNEHSRPVPVTMTPQRPIQGLVGPGDMEFNEDSPEVESPLSTALKMDKTNRANSIPTSHNGTPETLKPKKPPRQHVAVPLPVQLTPSAGGTNTSTVITNSDASYSKPQKLTLLSQAKSTTASAANVKFSDAFPLNSNALTDARHHHANTTTVVSFNHSISSDAQHPSKQTTSEEGGLWSPPASEKQKKFFTNDENWANFTNVPQQPENVTPEPAILEDDSLSSKVENIKENDNENVENESKEISDVWHVTDEQKEYYINQFTKLQPTGIEPVIKGTKARDFFLKSTLPTEILSKIWHLSDINKDRALDINEFCIAMHLVVAVRHGIDLPNSLPESLRQLASREITDSDNESGTPPQSRKVPSIEPVEIPNVQTPTSPTEQWAVFPTSDKDGAVTKAKTLPSNQIVTVSSSQPPSIAAQPQSNTLPAVLPQSPLTSPTNTESPALDITYASPQSKKMSTEIARPRVATPVVNLMDSHPAQLLPPPLSKGKITKQGKQNIASPLASPSRVVDVPILSEFTTPSHETAESQIIQLKENDAIAAGNESSPYKPTALPRPQKTIVPLRSLSIDKQPDRHRSSSSSSSDSSDDSRSDASDTSSNSSDTPINDEPIAPVTPVQPDLEVPPTPPPRKSHGRSSSLDLNKVFGNKQQPSPGSGRPLGTRTVSQDSISSTCSQSRSYRPDSTPDPDILVKDETDKFADFGKFPAISTTSEAKEIIARPRPLPSHRRSTSLDWSKQNSVLPSAKVNDDIPIMTIDDGQMKLPKRPAPSPPKSLQKINLERGPVEEIQDDTNTSKADAKKFHAPNVVIRPLEKKTKRQELEETIRIFREKNISSTNVIRNLQSQLREIMTDRASLETKLENMKPDKSKD